MLSTAVLVLLLGTPASAARAGEPPWGAGLLRQARAAGFAGPAAPRQVLTRDRFVRWVVRADDLKPRHYDPAPDMAGVAGTRALADGSLGAAASAGILDFLDYGGTGDFGGRQPIPRQEAVVMAVRMLGLAPQAVRLAGAGTALPFADAASVPAWARGFWSVALRAGIVDGFPDGTLRPQRPLTAAEGAAVLLRALAAWRRVEVSGVRVAAGGHTFAALTARVAGRLYVSGDALYGHLPGAVTLDGGGGDAAQAFDLGVGDRVWRSELDALICRVGSRDCSVWNASGAEATVRLPAAPMLMLGRVLLPVAARLPFLSVSAGSGRTPAVGVGATSDWPRSWLPTRRSGAVPVPSKLPAGIQPGARVDLDVTFRNPAGAPIMPVKKFTATFSVPPGSPLRLSAAAGTGSRSHASLTVRGRTPSATLVVSGARNVAQGEFPVTATIDGYGPVHWSVPVRDLRPYAFAAQVESPLAAGRTAAVEVTLLDRNGRPAADDVVPGTVRVRVVGPKGAVPVRPVYRTPYPTGFLLFDQGVGTFRFTPPLSGPYTLTVSGSVPLFAPWPLTPARLQFRVP